MCALAIVGLAACSKNRPTEGDDFFVDYLGIVSALLEDFYFRHGRLPDSLQETQPWPPQLSEMVRLRPKLGEVTWGVFEKGPSEDLSPAETRLKLFFYNYAKGTTDTSVEVCRLGRMGQDWHMNHRYDSRGRFMFSAEPENLANLIAASLWSHEIAHPPDRIRLYKDLPPGDVVDGVLREPAPGIGLSDGSYDWATPGLAPPGYEWTQAFRWVVKGSGPDKGITVWHVPSSKGWRYPVEGPDSGIDLVPLKMRP